MTLARWRVELSWRNYGLQMYDAFDFLLICFFWAELEKSIVS
jgi:hypothetical protein